jgi:hypothetical protein
MMIGGSKRDFIVGRDEGVISVNGVERGWEEG